MPYATGSAFLAKSESAYNFAREIGLEPLPINDSDSTILKGEWIPDTWRSGLDKLPYPVAVRESFKKFRKELLAIDLEKRGKELSRVPFSDLLKWYPDEIKQWWDNYGPSNWGAVSEETSAVLAIGDLREMAGDNGSDYYTWPGGLGAVTRKLTELLEKTSASQMRAGATIVAVVQQKDEVHVTYIDGAELKTVAAKAVIMATPKFITRRLVEGLPTKQSEAMHQIRYIPYAVVNLIFDKPVYNKGYDTWCPGNRFSDIVVADWVVRNQPGYKQKYNILTCYTPLREEERGLLLTEPGARQVAAKVLEDFQLLLPGSNVNPLEVHPLVRQPMERIFFANTDSEGPESTISGGTEAAERTVKEVKRRLAG